MEQGAWGRADFQTPGIYDLKDCRFIFTYRCITWRLWIHFLEVCKPLKFSVEIVRMCVRVQWGWTISYSLHQVIKVRGVSSSQKVKGSGAAQWNTYGSNYSIFSSIQLLNHVPLFATPLTACSMPGLPVPSPTPRACSNSCPLGRCCHPTISSSVFPFSHLQSFPASGSFQMSQLFASGGQSIGISASASVLPKNIQD